MSEFPFKISIVGLGLIGGSLAMAFKRNELGSEIIGVDLDERAIKIATEIGAIDRGTVKLSRGVKDADIVIVATPVRTIVQIIREIIPYLKPATIISDVGSTKSRVVRRVEEMLPSDIFYVGGHPMAGSEQIGIEAADPYLFENAVYILTVTSKTDPSAVNTLSSLLERIRAQVIKLSPEEHDRIVAAVSHLPHLAAVCLMNTVGKISASDSELLSLAAGGFRDTTRVASGSPAMWRDIFLTNKDVILRVLNDFKATIEEMEEFIREESNNGLMETLERAKELRDNIPRTGKGLLPSIYEIVIPVPDKPGVISRISSALKGENLNIRDIEIMHIREEERGTMKLELEDNKSLERALVILRREGFAARRR